MLQSLFYCFRQWPFTSPSLQCLVTLHFENAFSFIVSSSFLFPHHLLHILSSFWRSLSARESLRIFARQATLPIVGLSSSDFYFSPRDAPIHSSPPLPGSFSFSDSWHKLHCSFSSFSPRCLQMPPMVERDWSGS